MDLISSSQSFISATAIRPGVSLIDFSLFKNKCLMTTPVEPEKSNSSKFKAI